MMLIVIGRILFGLAILYFLLRVVINSLKHNKKEVIKYKPGIIKAIDRAFLDMKSKKWDCIYFYFDIHHTLLYPDYDNTTAKFYPYAKEVLKYLQNRKDIKMALYTCSYPEEIERYQKFFKENKIEFVYVNKNPDIENNKYGSFEDKPYFNVLFEDKAGFDAENDWLAVKNYFKI